MNQPLLDTLPPDEVDVLIQRAEEAEVDEMWSYVGKKTALRWLWHAIDHQTGKVLAYVFGRRKDEVFLRLKTLLEPFGIVFVEAIRFFFSSQSFSVPPTDQCVNAMC